MFRFLRKYNKWILAVGGTLLLIVFLIPQAIQGLSQAAAVSNAPRATIADPDGTTVDVTDRELRTSQRDLEFMQRYGVPVPGLGRITDPWHWFLLVREADQAGLIGGRPPGLDPTQFQNSNFSAAAAEDVIVRLGGVTRLVGLYQTSGKLSDRRLRAAADDLFQGANVRLVVLEASSDAVDHQPSEAEIKAQMDEYPDVLPGAGDTPYGYKLPDRVKLEWLVVPEASVRATVEASDKLSGKELRKHWRRNSGQVGFPPLPDEPPASVPDEVREDLLSTLVADKLDEIARTGTSQLRARTHGLPRDGAYLVLPDDWETARIGFQDLAATLQERFEIDIPEYHSTGTWLSAADLLDLEGIGIASTDRFPPTIKRLDELVTLAREFQGSVDVLIQSGVAGPVLNDADGNLYFFRIIDTDPSRPPASVDEVRDEVVADLRRIAHYEQLSAGLSGIETQAETEGLVAVALGNETIVNQPVTVYPYDQTTLQIQTLTRRALTPEPTRLPLLGPDEETVRAIMDYVDTFPRDQNFDSLSTAQKIFTIPVENKLAVVVGELVQRIPFTEPIYRERVTQGQLQTVVLLEELDVDAIIDTFGYEALAARHQFTPLRATTDEEAATQPETEVADASGDS